MTENVARVGPAFIRRQFIAPRVSVVAAVVGLGLPMVTVWAQDDPQRRSYSVEAPAMVAITIDGDLRDWPPAIARHPVSKILVIPSDYGFGGLRNADLSTSPDLSVAFSVGYDPRKQLIYLAVIVRDDKLVVGNTSHLDTDALEIFIDGLHSDKQIGFPNKLPWWDNIDLSVVPVQQYVAIPGPGKMYGSNYDTNPILMAGDLKKTKTRMAFRREGDVTTYEWAIQPFDQYPDQPTQLKPGKRIGFDLAVVDKDVPSTSPKAADEPEEDRPAWVYWGPQWAGMKVFNAGNLGELVLGKLGRVLSTDNNVSTEKDTKQDRPAAPETTRSDDRRFPEVGAIRTLVHELEQLVESQQAQLRKTENTLIRAQRLVEALETPGSGRDPESGPGRLRD